MAMASNYPAGVTDATIDALFGGDDFEPGEPVVWASDILTRLLHESDGKGREIIEDAMEHLASEGRLHA
jgi:hypothetical protein